MLRSLTTREDVRADRTAGDPTADELVAIAAAMRPRLLELQEQHEEEGGYSEEIHQRFLEGGFYRALHPKKYGGLELSLVDFLRIGIEISRGDPGVGWSYILGAGHSFHVASFYEEAAQAELFDGTLIAPGRTIPRGRAHRVAGGYRLDGTWDYCSGSRWSNWVLVVAPTVVDDAQPPTLKMFAVPRSEYTILDDWGGDQIIGMRASSSNSIRISDVFVPEHLVIPYNFREHVLGERGTAGYQIHRNPLYLGRTMTFFNAELVATQVGAAWAAFDQVDLLTRSRPASFPPQQPRRDAAEYHRWYGEILGLTDSSESLLLSAARQYEELGRRWAESGQEFTPEQDARLRLVVQRAAMLAGQAVQLAFETAGSYSARKGVPLQKYIRDVSMYRTHIAAQWDVTFNSTGRYLLGQPLTF